MSAPPVLATTPTPGCTSEPKTPRDQVERCIRVAAAVLDETGYPMGPKRMHKLVHRYVNEVARNGWTFLEFFSTALQFDADQRRRIQQSPEVARAIAYADHTGETAIANVLRERGY